MPPTPNSKRSVALCYIRQSYTRNENDISSPERQKANIAAYCEKKGWTPEWYEDAEGHKSGRYVANRPGWLALEHRIREDDVVALVANDLARLHRKTWRVGQLMDKLDEHGVHLVLAAPGREIDTSTPMGRMLITILAMQDEAYANDISQRAKDSINYRKAMGRTVGIPPFGTTRNDDGFLAPSEDGAWYLPDGSFSRGERKNPPHQDAVWRSYYDCAHHILELYSEGNMGLDKIAYQLNDEGWAFQGRDKNPRPVSRADVRRVVANWPEYGGIVHDRRAKDRPAYEHYDVHELPFVEDRAVFPVKLLRRVAEVRQARTIRPAADHGAGARVRVYPLSVITYCAHCEQVAKEHNDPGLRSTLTGHSKGQGKHWYRHKSGIKCGCTNRSVRREIIERDFARLLNLLTVDETQLARMTELAIQLHGSVDSAEDDFERKKREAISLCHRRIEAAVHLYGDGRIGRSEYLRRIETSEREIGHWEVRTTETQKAALELAMCVEAIDKIARVWSQSNDEDKRDVARSLFDALVFNLDTRRIVGFRLKPWAERFLVLRAALYPKETDKKKSMPDGVKGMDTEMPPRRFELLSWP